MRKTDKEYQSLFAKSSSIMLEAWSRGKFDEG